MPGDEQKSINRAETMLGRPLSLQLYLYRQLYLTNYDMERDK